MASKKKLSATHTFKVIYLVSLVLLVNIAYILSFLLSLRSLVWRNFQTYVVLIPFISLSTFLMADFLHLPRFFRKKNLDALTQSLRFSLIQTLLTISFAYIILPFFVEQRNAFPRTVLVVSCPLIFILTAGWSLMGLSISKRLYPQDRLVILGNNDIEMDEIESKIGENIQNLGLDLAGKLHCDEKTDLDDLLFPYSEILICPGLSDKLKSDIIHYCARKNIMAYLVPQFYEIALYQSNIIYVNDLMVFMIDRMRFSFEQRIVKKIFDLLIAAFALILLSPALLVSAFLIKLTSPGPVFFKQKRVTLDNKVFTIYKLRTMYTDAESETGPVFSGKRDPRVTAFGRFLRRSKLDEVPQFINVIFGDMSVVGPRSERPEFIEQFEKEIPAYHQRFSVKAGITGLAQVAGSYDTSAEDKLRYDLLYIRNYSLLQDIKIIFQTVRTIFTPHLYNKTFQENREENVNSISDGNSKPR